MGAGAAPEGSHKFLRRKPGTGLSDAPLQWFPIDRGFLLLWHRPGRGDLAALAAGGCTDVVTLQAAREHAEEVGAAAASAGLAWHWVPLDGANKPLLERKDVQRQIRDGLRKALRAVRGGGRVVVHCAAGIHRTGVFGYSLMRLCGRSVDDAVAGLHIAREATGRGVGEWRLQLAERVLVAPMLAAAASGDGDEEPSDAGDGVVDAVSDVAVDSEDTGDHGDGRSVGVPLSK